jgi:fluoroquinolone resistance protein
LGPASSNPPGTWSRRGDSWFVKAVTTLFEDAEPNRQFMFGKGYNTLMSFLESVYYQEKFSRLSVLNEIIEAREFEECEFEVCSFLNCKFEKCQFLRCELKECTFSAIDPHESRFLEVKFSGSKVIGFDWAKSAKVEDLEFTDCQINYSNFKLLKVPKIKIINCQAKEVDFIETDMNHGTFKNTDFEKSRFLKTDLSYSDFSGAKNYSINLLDNKLKKAKFSLPEALSLLNGLDIIIE